MIEGIYGPIPENQYLTFDISKMLDQKFFVNVQHYQKKDGSIGAKITGVSPFNPTMCNPAEIVRTNDLIIYSVQMGFDNIHFAKMYYFDRKSVKESYEGRAHAAAGGWFSKLDENGNVVKDDGNYNSTPAPAAPAQKLIMTNPAIPYESFKAQGWTDEMMVQAGHARYEAPVQQMAPAPIPVAAPVAAIPQPKIIMVDPNADYQAHINIGWTDETLVANGLARLNPAAISVPAPAPVPIPAPIAAPVPQAPVDSATLFAATPAAPVQQMAPAPIPVAAPAAPVASAPPAPISGFEVPAPVAFDDKEHDDLPF
jgi:hypothetical protein